MITKGRETKTKKDLDKESKITVVFNSVNSCELTVTAVTLLFQEFFFFFFFAQRSNQRKVEAQISTIY